MTGINLRDLAFKALWTGPAAVAGFAMVAVADLATWWAPIAIMAATAISAFARQKTGVTPPDARTLTEVNHSH